jgi:hypothetical protein
MAVKEYGGADRKRWGDDQWLIVRSRNQWLADDEHPQKYAVAMTFESTDPSLYNEVRSRVTQRATVRARARARV